MVPAKRAPAPEVHVALVEERLPVAGSAWASGGLEDVLLRRGDEVEQLSSADAWFVVAALNVTDFFARWREDSSEERRCLSRSVAPSRVW